MYTYYFSMSVVSSSLEDAYFDPDQGEFRAYQTFHFSFKTGFQFQIIF